jgi:hypothetical protein
MKKTIFALLAILTTGCVFFRHAYPVDTPLVEMVLSTSGYVTNTTFICPRFLPPGGCPFLIVVIPDGLGFNTPYNKPALQMPHITATLTSVHDTNKIIRRTIAPADAIYANWNTPDTCVILGFDRWLATLKPGKEYRLTLSTEGTSEIYDRGVVNLLWHTR